MIASRAHTGRGFVFLYVLAVIVIGTISIGATLSASAFKSNIAERRVQSYTRQHEALSVRDIVLWWLMRQNQENQRRAPSENPMLALSRSPGASQRFTLESGVVVNVSVEDAQGRILARLDDTLPAAEYQWLLTALSRLPQDRVDLVRRHGPVKVSLLTAPDEVLLAIAGGDTEVGGALIEARETEISDPAAFARLLASRGIETEVAQLMLRRVALTPTLWEDGYRGDRPERGSDPSVHHDRRADLDVPRRPPMGAGHGSGRICATGALTRTRSAHRLQRSEQGPRIVGARRDRVRRENDES